ncbi:hypothetical protein L1049_025511 [Liquidambar formosana]|uniref:Kinesin motor domain-containing protein n=1 Tax=Liquidambar formosana TaxID=63359 RepID=A0AAP0R6I7_LIQFO
METQCPNTATIRRNPHRKARPTPSNTAAPPIPHSLSALQDIPSFPMDDILSIQVAQNPQPNFPTSSGEAGVAENLKVFLRIRPLKPLQGPGKFGKNGDQTSKLSAKNVWPQNPSTKNTANEKNKKKKCEICITVNDSRSVTLSPSSALQDLKRIKSEVYEGFSHVFSADSSQDEVYETMVNPLVEDFLGGKSGMFAALGPSGSGKTHTVFGSPREPGMVPLVLRRIFKQTGVSGSETSRSFYISMFEIYSERGKGERVLDLSPNGGDLFMQQSTIKGLQEVIISDVAQAESLIGRGMLKRATAMTNTNSQSSRSQCIISIRCALEKSEGEADVQSNNAVLTIVDLAGAEREKKTGNQGTRLLESNFINNTSMVFGLCLRSLLEHQKNPKKPLQKHFQNSLLTRYLRDYLEGKKRMTLILTVKSGEEDYLDTSFLLRQASPYMKIKFHNVEEPSNLICNKRQFQTLPRFEQPKRFKFSGLDVYAVSAKKLKEFEPVEVLVQSPKASKSNVDDNGPLKPDSFNLAERERNSQIMQGFAKALWNVLKEYKDKLEVAENVIHSLRDDLRIEKTRNLELEKQLEDLKSSCSCSNSESRANNSPGLVGHASNFHEGQHDTSLFISLLFRYDCVSVTGSRLSEVVVSSPQSLAMVKNDNCSIMELNQLHNEKDENLLDPPLSLNENEAFTRGCNVGNVPETESNLNSCCKRLNVEKPKRRLLPASSLLLRDIGGLNFEDESEKPKGIRGEKKLAADETKRTQGSLSLLHLLRSNLHR